jgi:hypothetical protein
MKGDTIKYRSGYKYQLVNDYRVLTSINPDYDVVTEFLELSREGILTIRHGYAWDGPSGPTIDTPNFMRGSLIHDALAQLCRDGYISRLTWATAINLELQKACIEDGMSPLRAWWVFVGVEHLGGDSWLKWGDGGKHLRVAP